VVLALLQEWLQPGFLLVTFNPDNSVKERIAIIDPSGDRRESK
jgi:hypothetical protein